MKIRISTNLLLIMIVALVMVVCTTLPASATAKVPAKVAGVKVTKATNTAISISWKKARNAKLYQVNYKKASAKKWIALKKTKALKITKSGLKANTKYNFKVRGVNGKKYGKFSKVITQTTYATPGKVNVKTIFAKKRTRNSVELQWSKAANSNKYEIQPYRLSGGALVSDESTGTSCKLGYLPTPNTWYGFKNGRMAVNEIVEAQNGDYYVNGSGIVSFSKGWRKIYDTWYYFDQGGKMLRGLQYVDGTLYNLQGYGYYYGE